MKFSNPWTAVQSLGLAVLLSAAGAAHAQAQAYPTAPVKVIAPFAAGGAIDVVARTLADHLSRSFGQPVIVDNKTGAAGNIGVDAVAKAPADGYTISVALSSNLMINQFLYTKLPYDPGKDLRLVAKIADAPLVLVVNSGLKVNNAQELRTYVAQNKGKLSYGSWGLGTIAHMSASRISDMLDAGMTHIPYRGESLMINDLIAGNVQISFVTGAQAPQFIADGRLKAIGVSGPARIKALPDVPTLTEAGFDDPLLRAVGWVGMAAPRGTPEPIVQKLSAGVGEALKRPDVQERIRALGWEPSFQGPAEIAATYQREAPLWKKVVEQSGAKLD
jgi:tripartite-type tricarboxylate transporter receptor subunit TctC